MVYYEFGISRWCKIDGYGLIVYEYCYSFIEGKVWCDVIKGCFIKCCIEFVVLRGYNVEYFVIVICYLMIFKVILFVIEFLCMR